MDEAALIEFMRKHQGIAARAELRQLGATDKMISSRAARGILQEIHPGVFWFRAVPWSWWSAMRAATEWARPAAGSHRSAAAALGLDGFPTSAVEITTTRRVRGPEPPIVHRVAELDPREVRVRRGIPFTVVERTLVDLGAVCPGRKVEQALDDAIRQRLTTVERIQASITRHSTKGRSGPGVLKALLKERLDTGFSESDFERALFRMIQRFQLPTPVKQHPITCGGRGFRFDFAYPAAMVAVEALSYLHHSLRDDWEADYARHDMTTADGWRILYVTYRRLCDHPDEVAEEIRKAIRLSGLF